jgi:DNA-binding HxlR family transcriptional regulator
MNSEVTKYGRKEDCPLTFALTLIGSKWRLPIIWALWQDKTLRYNELKRRVDGITNMVLSSSLKEMENQGLVVRKQYMEIPPRVEYSLTKAGEDLIPSLESLAK